MNDQSHDNLFTNIKTLRERISLFSTEAVVFRVMEAAGPLSDQDVPSALFAPRRQAYYLLGLMLGSPEPRKAEDLSDEKWAECVGLLQRVYDTYALMFFPEDGDFASKSAEWEKARRVAMPAFLHHFTTTRNFASIEQVTDRIMALLQPFEAEVRASIGLAPAAVVAMTRWVQESMQKDADEMNAVMQRLGAAYKQFRRLVRLGMSQEKALGAVQTSDNLEELRRGLHDSRHIFKIRLWTLQKEFGRTAAEAYWNRFVSHRRPVPPGTKLFTYPTEANPAEGKPLFLHTKKVALCPIINAVYDAAMDQMVEALTLDKESKTAKAFYRHRDKYLEQEVEAVFRALFGAEGEYFASAYDQPTSHGEHDLVILCNRRLVIVEAKASGAAEPFRDPEKAFLRIKRQFDSEAGISKAYQQADRLRSALASDGAVNLYDVSGTRLRRVEQSEVDAVYRICVTLDSFGALATDLSLLLEKKPEVSYPWATNLYDLQTFVNGLMYRQWGPGEFCRYLDERSALHGRVHASDEMEIAGVFLTQGSLETLADSEADAIFLMPNLSDVFDEIYMEGMGGPKADLSPKLESVIRTGGSRP